MADVDVRQWQLLGSGSQLEAGRGYTLHNTRHQKSVRYRSRRWGINLVWDTSRTLGNVTLEHADGSTGPIRYGDPIALRVDRDGSPYLRYQRRDNGVQLVWSSVPVPEWELIRGAPGRIVPTSQSMSIFNRRHGDHLVYGERSRGINLRWWSELGVGLTPTGTLTSSLFGSYLPLSLPHLMRSPSREPGQIELSGIVEKITVFHGGVDDELDWHIYLRPSFSDVRRLGRQISQHAFLVLPAFDPEDLARMYCEWMVLDGWDNSFFDEKFFSADVGRALALDSSAWVLSEIAAEKQNVSGASEDATRRSALTDARVTLQGPLVNDAAHGFKVEIHPLDSLAYALVNGAPTAATPGGPGWPSTTVTWRVAAFTNSSFHRINRADYLKKDRQIRWYLPLPSDAPRRRIRTSVSTNLPGFANESVGRSGLDDRRPGGATFQSHGVVRHSSRLAIDPRDGERKLRVDITMRRPDDRWGGMFLGEYTVTSRPIVRGPGVDIVEPGRVAGTARPTGRDPGIDIVEPGRVGGTATP